MPENGQIRAFFNNIFASAAWDAIKRGLGCSLVTGFATALWEKLRHGSLDWYAIGGMFVLTLIVVLSIFWKQKPTPPTPTKSAHPQSRLRILAAHYGIEGISDPDVTEYLLERLHGNAFAEPIVGDLFHGRDPVPGKIKRLKVHYSFDGKAATVTRPEYTLLVLPEDTFLKEELEKCRRESKLNENQLNAESSRWKQAAQQCEQDLRDASAKLKVIKPLQYEAIRIAQELHSFLKGIGLPPAPKHSREQLERMSTQESRRLIEAQDGDYAEAMEFHYRQNPGLHMGEGQYANMIVSRMKRLWPFYDMVRAQYALHFKQTVEEIWNKFTIEGLADDGLLLPVDGLVGIKNIKAIAAKLWELAYKLGERELPDEKSQIS